MPYCPYLSIYDEYIWRGTWFQYWKNIAGCFRWVKNPKVAAGTKTVEHTIQKDTFVPSAIG